MPMITIYPYEPIKIDMPYKIELEENYEIQLQLQDDTGCYCGSCNNVI